MIPTRAAASAVALPTEPIMTIYAVEINGRGIAAFNDSSFLAAKDFVGNTFRHDLKVMIYDRKPLWDGSNELFLREAFPEE
jgi:hypothetical protein